MNKSVQQQSSEDNQAYHHHIRHPIRVGITVAAEPLQQMFTHGQMPFMWFSGAPIVTQAV